jgi:hypothetical protein
MGEFAGTDCFDNVWRYRDGGNQLEVSTHAARCRRPLAGGAEPELDYSPQIAGMNMIYREKTIPKTPGQLTDQLGVAILNSPKRVFPKSVIDGKPYWDFDGIFYSVQRGIENLREHLGHAKAVQLLEMLAQAKVHHEEGWRLTSGGTPPADRPRWWDRKDAPSEMPGWWQRRIGNALLQDMQAVIRDRQPWAYPKGLYRWPVDSSLPELSEADLLSRGDE